MSFSKFTLLLVFVLWDNHPLAAAIIGANVSAQPLTVARIATLSPAQQPAWKEYLERSARQMRADQDYLRAELKAHDLKEPINPPIGKGAGRVPLNESDAWYGQDEGRRIADIIVSYQTPAGGWSKNLDLTRKARPPGGYFALNNNSRFLGSSDYDLPQNIGWSSVGTFDNGATTTQLRYLAKTITAVGPAHDARYRAAFLRGLYYIFTAQYPNDGWPQVWPLEGGYHDAITYNDGAMLCVLELLSDVADGRDEFSFVPADKRAAAAASFKRGLNCVIATQIIVDGRRTVWCQQHDPLTLKPVSGRNYEMSALCSPESANIMMFLMKLPNPGPEVVTAVHAAAAWFEKTQIRDVAFKHLGDEGRKLVSAPGNGPIWARYYGIGTDRPIFGDRDKTIHDDVNEISLERRDGYAWYRDTPELALRQYARWSQEHTEVKMLGKEKPVWTPDNGDGTFKNPIIHADYSDPDVVRVGDDFYLVSSSFNCAPGLPILHSRDLVNWTIIGHVFQNYPVIGFDAPQHGNGVWAPSLRHHNGEFYVYFGDPDNGIFMSKAKDPAGPWSPLHLVQEAKGWIDACPFWDDDGKAYLVHAWAKSRSGIKSILTINRMSPDGTKLLDEGTLVFDGSAGHPTIEGPKLYKRNGYYYIFAPAGGVTEGWQTVLRSTNVFGPYEDKTVLAQGKTEINGPHQGGWVETQTGESWFIHFQDRGAYGRIVHLQPMKWVNDWPVIGNDDNHDGTGEPVLVCKKPDVGQSHPVAVPQTTDEFDSAKLGLQWQWQANFQDKWFSLTTRPGWLRLFSVPMPDRATNLWPVPNFLLQKLPALAFTVTTKLDFNNLAMGERAGLIIMGMDYSYVAVERAADGFHLIKAACKNANDGGNEIVESEIARLGEFALLRIKVNPGAVCDSSYSTDGKEFIPMGKRFTARPGRWIGAKVGLFCLAKGGVEKQGYADFDWFRFD